MSLDEKNANFLRNFTKTLDTAFASLQRKTKDDDASTMLDQPNLDASEKRRRFSNQFLKNSADWFGSLRKTASKEGDQGFLVAKYGTREASQHSLLKQLQHQHSKPRMRSKIGCFYFADLQYLSRPESPQTLEEPVSTVHDYVYSTTVILGSCGNGRLFVR